MEEEGGGGAVCGEENRGWGGQGRIQGIRASGVHSRDQLLLTITQGAE